MTQKLMDRYQRNLAALQMNALERTRYPLAERMTMERTRRILAEVIIYLRSGSKLLLTLQLTFSGH